MNAIINPWWFYFIDVCGGLKNCSITFAVLFGIAAIVSVVCWQYFENETRRYGNDGSDRCAANAWLWGFKLTLIVFVIFLLLALFVPSSATVGYMLTATLATTDNINIVYDTIIKTATDLLAMI